MTSRERLGDCIDEDADLKGRVHCPNRFRHLTSSQRSATIWVGSVDPFARCVDHTGGVVDHTCGVVVLFGEVERPFEGGAPSPTERSTTGSMRSATLSMRSGDLVGGVVDHFDGRG